MKTLVIQLARFGDVFQSWPTLSALSQDPSKEIHLLVRERFLSATLGLPTDIRVHEMKTSEILRPFYEDKGEKESLEGHLRGPLEDFLRELENENFDEVINLSYSPFSSYLSSYFSMRGARVSGYTRHSDGFLNMSDDASAYFYAQVGVERPNRIHVTQLFAMTAGVDLERAHLYPKVETESPWSALLPKDYFVIHVGASDHGKVLKPSQWSDLVRSFLEVRSEFLVFVGVDSEKEIAQAAKPRLGSDRIIDLTGKTRIQELFPVIKNAQGFIGCDSSPLQIASLMNVPTLNLRNSCVNTAETGPFGERFVIWDFEANPKFEPLAVKRKMDELFDKDLVSVVPFLNELAEQQWMMLKALYLGGDYPQKVLKQTLVGIVECMEQLPGVFEAYNHSQTQDGQKTIRRFDEWIVRTEKQDPLLAILLRWFDAERIRVAPGTIAETQDASREILDKLYLILSDWLRTLEEKMSFISPLSDPQEHLFQTAKNFRFLNLTPALHGLETLMHVLAEEFSTEVQLNTFNQIKGRLEAALNASDFECVADLLEYELNPLLREKDVLMWSGENAPGLL